MKRVRTTLLVTLVAILVCGAAAATETPNPGTAAPQSAAAHFDPDAATAAYLATMSPEARAKSDAYFEGGYWLILWDLVAGLVVAWLFLGTGLSARMRDWVERVTRFRWLQTALYSLQYIAIAVVVMLPWSAYEGYFREHQYGMSNQTLGAWLGDQAKGLAIGAGPRHPRDHRDLRRPAQGAADVVAVGVAGADRLRDVRRGDRAGLPGARVQQVQAAGRHAAQAGDPLDGARERHPGDRRLRVRRLEADQADERERQRAARHDADRHERQPDDPRLGRGDQGGDRPRDGPLRPQPRLQGDGAHRRHHRRRLRGAALGVRGAAGALAARAGGSAASATSPGCRSSCSCSRRSCSC